MQRRVGVLGRGWRAEGGLHTVYLGSKAHRTTHLGSPVLSSSKEQWENRGLGFPRIVSYVQSLDTLQTTIQHSIQYT
jgi:hypothetical protein